MRKEALLCGAFATALLGGACRDEPPNAPPGTRARAAEAITTPLPEREHVVEAALPGWVVAPGQVDERTWLEGLDERLDLIEQRLDHIERAAVDEALANRERVMLSTRIMRERLEALRERARSLAERPEEAAEERASFDEDVQELADRYSDTVYILARGDWPKVFEPSQSFRGQQPRPPEPVEGLGAQR